jgi:HEPN domain-containing protein
MSREEAESPSDWVDIAEKDWERAHRLWNKDPELAGFCLQQAVEKFLKGFLLAHEWELRRIHGLDALLDDAVSYDPDLESYRSICQRISAFYLIERYPTARDAQITRQDVRNAIDRVQGLVDRIREHLEDQ